MRESGVVKKLLRMDEMIIVTIAQLMRNDPQGQLVPGSSIYLWS